LSSRERHPVEAETWDGDRRGGSASLSIATSTARSIRSSSQSVGSSAKVRPYGLLQNLPIRSARSRSGSMKTWRSSARGAARRPSSHLPNRPAPLGSVGVPIGVERNARSRREWRVRGRGFGRGLYLSAPPPSTMTWRSPHRGVRGLSGSPWRLSGRTGRAAFLRGPTDLAPGSWLARLDTWWVRRVVQAWWRHRSHQVSRKEILSHLAVWQEPCLCTTKIRAAFRSLR
jgi:hypothetical protein